MPKITTAMLLCTFAPQMDMYDVPSFFPVEVLFSTFKTTEATLLYIALLVGATSKLSGSS